MATPSAAFEALMNGVTSWDVPEDAIPCELLLIGEASFPVMVNDMGQVLIAGSSYGRGRLVVVSHEDYLALLFPWRPRRCTPLPGTSGQNPRGRGRGGKGRARSERVPGGLLH